MTKYRMLCTPLIAALLLLPGCIVAPAPDYVVAPALPVIVELDVVPYHYRGYYYHYHNHDRRWSYSRSKAGPWRELPRDRYPREIRYKDRGYRR